MDDMNEADWSVGTMTVAQLIEKLKEMPQDAMVLSQFNDAIVDVYVDEKLSETYGRKFVIIED